MITGATSCITVSLTALIGQRPVRLPHRVVTAGAGGPVPPDRNRPTPSSGAGARLSVGVVGNQVRLYEVGHRQRHERVEPPPAPTATNATRVTKRLVLTLKP
jgi:hypothetical protein